MKITIMAAVMLILFSFSNGCTFNASVIHHDEDQAIDVTNKFLKSLIEENYDTAYNDYLGDRLKKSLSYERFENDVKQGQQTRGSIQKATFDSYMDVPTQRAIQLFYSVDHEKAGAIIYHFVVEGDKSTGYKVVLVDVGNQVEYPPNMKLFGLKKMKKDKPIIVIGD